MFFFCFQGELRASTSSAAHPPPVLPPPRSGGSGASRVSFQESPQGPSPAAPSGAAPTPSPRKSALVSRTNGNPKDAPHGPQGPQGYQPHRTPSGRAPNGLPKGRGAPGSKLTNGRIVSKGSSTED